MSGIKTTEHKCACGGHIRLHWCTFAEKTDDEKVKWYADCDRTGAAPHCPNVTEWRGSESEALAEADAYTKPEAEPSAT